MGKGGDSFGKTVGGEVALFGADGATKGVMLQAAASNQFDPLLDLGTTLSETNSFGAMTSGECRSI